MTLRRVAAATLRLFAGTESVGFASAGRFDGFYTYDFVTYGGDEVRAAPTARRTRPGSLCAPSVGPGYDGRRAGEPPVGRDRANGARTTPLAAALPARPDMVTITSYNEWGEGRRSSRPQDGAATLVRGRVGDDRDGRADRLLTRTAYWAARACAHGARASGAGRDLDFPGMATRAVPAPLAQLPNALTSPAAADPGLRRADDPGGGRAQLAGRHRLRRSPASPTRSTASSRARWHVESRFGKIADPLADRLMIDAAVILLVAYGRLPWAGLVVIARARPAAARRLARARAARDRPRGQPGRQGARPGCSTPRSASGSSRTTRPAGRSGSSGSASEAPSWRRCSMSATRGNDCTHEGRRHGGRRGHAPSPAHVEPAEADGADRRQAVHGAHPRAAEAARARRT